MSNIHVSNTGGSVPVFLEVNKTYRTYRPVLFLTHTLYSTRIITFLLSLGTAC